jgi:hypothetical protein
MYAPGYTQKNALQDALKVIAYKVNTPSAPVVDELVDAESRLHDLTGAEVLAAMVAALNSGITPSVAPAPTVTADSGTQRRQQVAPDTWPDVG